MPRSCGQGSGAKLPWAASHTGSGSRSCDPKAGIYTPCSEIGKKDPFLLLDIFSNDLKESARLNELVHLSLHWKQLPRLRQEEGEAGGEEGKAAGREPLGRKGAGGRERSEGEKVETVGRKPR